MFCNDDRLNQLMIADDDTHCDAELAAHVDTCPRCQSRLLELAGGATWCDEASDVLSEAVPDSHASSSIVVAIDASLAGDMPAICEPLSLDFLATPSHPEMLGRLGRYEIENLIGAGGMGVVLKGFDTELHRPVAIKVLAPHLAGSGAARARFAREARAAAAIVHDHVIPIHNVESNAKLPYLVMPYIAGRSLQTQIDEAGSLPIKDSVRIALQTAQGLAAAHAQGIVHRDVKPANILLEEDVDRVRISDFGLARAVDDANVTRTGIIAGTPQYMSPEQTRGEAIDYRSDLFSLGSVIYAMTTGRPPFRAETTMGVLRKISDREPRSMREINSDVPVWLERLVDRLLAKLPADRYASAEQAATLLEQCLAHLQQPDTMPLPESLCQEPTRPPRKVRLRPMIVGVAAAAGLFVLAATVKNRPVDRVAPVPLATQPGARAPTDERQNTTDTTLKVSPADLLWNDHVFERLSDLSEQVGQLSDESQSLLANPPFDRQESLRDHPVSDDTILREMESMP